MEIMYLTRNAMIHLYMMSMMMTLLGTCLAVLDPPFSVVWNVPSEHCLKLGVPFNLTRYGISVNPRQTGWTGPVSTIFSDWFGLYPYISGNGSSVNGGIPQLGNLPAHLEKLEADVNKFMPYTGYEGLAVIDWEEWRATWSRNYDSKSIYQKLSRDLVRRQHPTWNRTQIETEAKLQFESAAKQWMLKSLTRARELRPQGMWGFYLFPECYNYHGERECATGVRADNDRLKWLFEGSSALFPSFYLGAAMNRTAKDGFVYGQIKEALRIRSELSDPYKPIFAYSRFTYEETKDFFSSTDLQSTIGQASNIGVNGVVLWGNHLNSKDVAACRQLQQFVDNTLGPFVLNTIRDSIKCSKERCSGHGRCVLRNKITEKLLKFNKSYFFNDILKSIENDNEMKLFFIKRMIRMMEHGSKFYSGTDLYDCQCYKGWAGPSCDKMIANDHNLESVIHF